jgi:anthranilate synthase component 1
MVRDAREHILAGDAFQVVPSQRFGAQTSTDPFQVYRALRILNPSPYMFFLDFDGFELIGSSPEVLVKLEGQSATLSPIAGTRPRGESPAEDEALAAELLANEKEHAEHVMLVDLGRNDLGRVCETGSVKVEALMHIERYSHVMHIVSSLSGTLPDGVDGFELLRACFPAGTVSGAPKIRAMEIIAALEGERRGPYAGAVGYFGHGGDMDMCIAIRTIVMIGDRFYVQAGGGVVADSDAAAEYEETVNKASALMRAVTIAEEGL